MGILCFLKRIISYILHIPFALPYLFKDLFYYIKHKKWKEFNLFGLHIWVAKFGGGKTSSMVRTAYNICKRYPQVSVLTNIKLSNFPSHTNILQLNTINDILNAPNNCLCIIDEIGTLFNSRDFMQGGAMPKIMLQHILQCRKKHFVLFGTVQQWDFLDRQLRVITDTVRVCRSLPCNPFTRLTSVTIYDGRLYEKACQNPLTPITPRGVTVHVQTDKLRRLYDTDELVSGMLKMTYYDDDTILRNTGIDYNPISLDKKARQVYKRNSKVL